MPPKSQKSSHQRRKTDPSPIRYPAYDPSTSGILASSPASNLRKNPFRPLLEPEYVSQGKDTHGCWAATGLGAYNALKKSGDIGDSTEYGQAPSFKRALNKKRKESGKQEFPGGTAVSLSKAMHTLGHGVQELDPRHGPKGGRGPSLDDIWESVSEDRRVPVLEVSSKKQKKLSTPIDDAHYLTIAGRHGTAGIRVIDPGQKRGKGPGGSHIVDPYNPKGPMKVGTQNYYPRGSFAVSAKRTPQDAADTSDEDYDV